MASSTASRSTSASTSASLLALRLRNQRLAASAASALRQPADIVAWLGAVQAQDYPAAKWALGLRAEGLTDAAVEQAFAAGSILRTHILRPTWHFVTPADIRWMLALTGPRVQTVMSYYYHHFDLSRRKLARCQKVLARALSGGHHQTRAELATALRAAGIDAAGSHLHHIMVDAELEAVICSGPRRGKQFTYALLDERAPVAQARTLSREEGLAELARRYFSSHGPATMQDFAWWSGLTVADGKRALEMLGGDVEQSTIDGQPYWLATSPAPESPSRARPGASAHLLPNYDEFIVAYRDRTVITGQPRGKGEKGENHVFSHTLVIDGRLAGTWTRTAKPDCICVDVSAHRPFTRADTRALAAAVERYRTFMNMPVVISKS